MCVCVGYMIFLCVLYSVCLCGLSGRCKYSSISTKALQSIASSPPLPPHQSLTHCHLPGSTESNGELLISRPPCRGILEYFDAVSRSPPRLWGNQGSDSVHALCCMCANICAFLSLCVCFCNHAIYKTWMMQVASVTGETLSFFSALKAHTKTLFTHARCSTQWHEGASWG